MPQQYNSFQSMATLGDIRNINTAGDLKTATSVAGDGSGPDGRPINSSEERTITVADAGGLQEALDSELPWLINHPHVFDLGGNSYGEVVVPPYVATISPSSDGVMPFRIKNGSVTSLDFGGGVGVCECVDMSFTGTSSLHNEDTAVSAYNTYRVSLRNCTIDTGGNGMISYNGHIHCNNVEVSAGGKWGTKVKQWGRYWETGGGTSGNGDYTVDTGIASINPPDGSRMSGGIQANDTTDGGYIYDISKGIIHGPNSIVMPDTNTGDLYEVTISGGSPSISKF